MARDLTTRATRRTFMGAAAGVSHRRGPKLHPEPEPILEQVTRARHQAETEAILAALNTMLESPEGRRAAQDRLQSAAL
jgi:hypothetical protein